MAKKRDETSVSAEEIERSIFSVRAQRVMLDSDLASLYGVEVKALNQAVKRNLDRFPLDFMFQVSPQEWEEIREHQSRSQNVTLVTAGRGRHRKYMPYVFTEQGVAMLSSVLRSQQAVKVNIEIMRTFVRLRKLLAANVELSARLDELERRLGKHDEQFVQVVRAIRQLMEPPPSPPRRKIGFRATLEEGATTNRSMRSRQKRNDSRTKSPSTGSRALDH